MGFYRSFVKPLMCLFALSGATDVAAATYVEKYDFVVSGFEFESNFWSRFNPAATNGGPSLVSELRLSATLSFRGTEDRVGVFSSGKIGVTDVAASVSTIVVPGLHDGTVDIVGFREPEMWPLQQSGMTGVSTPTGNSGQLIFLFEDRYGRDRPFFTFTFRLPGLLNGEMNLSGAYFDYEYRESPILMDSPKYRSAYSSSTWSVTRTTLEQASTTAPIPLPASLGFAASGLLLLTLTGRRRART